MKVKLKSAEKRVTLLENPEPEFMALVTHGANQTPWTALKADGRNINQTGDKTMPKSKGAKRETRLVRMNFSKAQFADEAAVKNYLENEVGVTDFEMGEHEDDVWVVKSTEDVSGLTLGKPRATPSVKAGVTLFIAEVEKGGEETPPKAKATIPMRRSRARNPPRSRPRAPRRAAATSARSSPSTARRPL